MGNTPKVKLAGHWTELSSSERKATRTPSLKLHTKYSCSEMQQCSTCMNLCSLGTRLNKYTVEHMNTSSTMMWSMTQPHVHACMDMLSTIFSHKLDQISSHKLCIVASTHGNQAPGRHVITRILVYTTIDHAS